MFQNPRKEPELYPGSEAELQRIWELNVSTVISRTVCEELPAHPRQEHTPAAWVRVQCSQQHCRGVGVGEQCTENTGQVLARPFIYQLGPVRLRKDLDLEARGGVQHWVGSYLLCILALGSLGAEAS